LPELAEIDNAVKHVPYGKSIAITADVADINSNTAVEKLWLNLEQLIF
jgi:hypothetical protein